MVMILLDFYFEGWFGFLLVSTVIVVFGEAIGSFVG